MAPPFVTANKVDYLQPARPPENVNVSRQHPLSEAAWLFGGLLVLILLIYGLLGLLVDWVVPYVPAESEAALGQIFQPTLEPLPTSPQQQQLEVLLEQMSHRLQPSPARPYQLMVVAADKANAMAIPGGQILLFAPLLEQAGSENELAFVLGHEMAHLHHRHSLKALGRSLVLMTAADLLLGQQNALSGFLRPGLHSMQMKFSQAQETEADELGLELVMQHYGHVAGVTDFFERQSKQALNLPLATYFDTHPQPEARIQHLKKRIADQQFPSKALTPLKKPD